MCSSARTAFSELTMTMMVTGGPMPTMPTRTGRLAIGDVVSDQGWEKIPTDQEGQDGSRDVLS